MPQINPAALVAIRERTGLTQSDLAKESGVSQGRISELEAKALSVRPGTVKALAVALQVPMTAISQPEPACSTACAAPIPTPARSCPSPRRTNDH